MTQEEQKILVHDLCARLPHGVNVWVKTHHGQIIESDILTLCNGGGYYSTLTYEGIMDDSVVKPYLRPLSAMTKDEREEYDKLRMGVSLFNYRIRTLTAMMDWLLQNHFDVYGLIGKGLALEAPEDMYNSQKE